MQDEHRLFVQIMMSERILTKRDAKGIIEGDLKKAGTLTESSFFF
jgi:hypothetical protein